MDILQKGKRNETTEAESIKYKEKASKTTRQTRRQTYMARLHSITNAHGTRHR
jgi:hypothetical protein